MGAQVRAQGATGRVWQVGALLAPLPASSGLLPAPPPLAHIKRPAPAPSATRPQNHRNWVLCLAWSPDATMVATGDMDGKVCLWQRASGKLLGICSGHSKWITSLVRGAGAGAGAGAGMARRVFGGERGAGQV